MTHQRTIISAAIIALVVASCAPQDAGEADNEWLNDSYGARALEWGETESARTLEAFGGNGRLASLEREAVAVLTDASRIPYGSIRGDYVYNYWMDEARPFGVWRRAPVDSYLSRAPQWEILLDLDQLSVDEGREWFFKGFSCAPDLPTRCLVNIAHKGMDAAETREFDLEAGEFIEDGFFIPESDSSYWWKDQDTLIVAPALDADDLNEPGYPRRLKLWRRGAALGDAEVLFEGDFTDAFASAAFIDAATSDSFVAVQSATYYSSVYWLMGADGSRTRLPLPSYADIAGGHDGKLILHVKEQWSASGTEFEVGDLVLISEEALLERHMIEGVELLYRPAPDESFRGLWGLDDRIIVNQMKNVRSRLIVLMRDEAGWRHDVLDAHEGFISLLSTAPDGRALAKYESPISADALYLVDLTTGAKELLYGQPGQFNSSDLRMEFLYATSQDGTRIPYTLIEREGAPRDADAPTLVYGYGGWETSVTPRYEPLFGKLWLEKSGTYVHAYIRGGAELGAHWHQAAFLDQRQRAYDDMAAVLEDLHARRITSPAHTGIMGRSNGGLLVATVMTQRPDLMNAVVVGGPLIDMLTYDRLGPGSSWTVEYGDPDVASERAYLETYSPYQNLTADTDYPTPLIITSIYDDRVWPGHARRFKDKMKRLGHDAYYYEDGSGGHYWELAGGPGPGDWRIRAKARAVEYAYLAERLGLE